uniref:endonuclease n=1 Tax=Thiolapillus sp. TaxID=2017437 RepID=UPI003AF5A1BF
PTLFSLWRKARRENSAASRLLGSTSLRFALHGWQRESDMHNMYPARKDVNQTRGAMAFGIIEGENHKYRGCDFEVDFRKRRVEPRPEVRGRIARAMLYMSDEYGLDIYRKQRKMLEKWNRQFPPDAEEKRHNRAVAKIQGKPNPYIR